MFQLAADAGNLIPMTEAEKKRLDELLSDETDLLMVEVCLKQFLYHVTSNLAFSQCYFTALCDWEKKLLTYQTTATRAPAFSRASGSLLFFSLNAQWLFVLFTFVLILRCDYTLFCLFDAL